MIFTESPEVNPNLTLDDLPGSFTDALGASASSALYNSPVWQLKRTWEDKFNAGGATLDYETARAKSRSAGVDIKIDPKGMTEGALDLLIERKRFQARTQDALARGPQGFVAGSAYFLTGLGAAMLDPVNLASAFIPVARGLGMSKDIARAGMLGEVGAAATAAGRVAARVRVGAVEGAVGQAMLEPLTAFRASQEQEDYGITDTLLNVGFGAALGAAAHAGLGVLGDKAAAAARERKAADLINAAKNVQGNDAPGKPVNYDTPTVFRKDSAAAKLQSADMETNSAVFRSEIAAAADGRVMDNSGLVDGLEPRKLTGIPELDNTVFHGSNTSVSAPDLTMTGKVSGITEEGRVFWVTSDRASAEGFAKQAGGDTINEFRLEPKNPLVIDVPVKDVISGAFGDTKVNALNQARANGNDVVLFRQAGNGIKMMADEIAVLDPAVVKSTKAAEARIDPIKVQQAAAASHLPENDVHFDAQAKAEVDAAVAARAAEADPAEAVLRATQEAQAELATLSQQLGLDPEKNAAMRSADDMASTASRYSKAIEAYASCQVRS